MKKSELFQRIRGSMVGLALGDALGAHVEFRPREYMLKHQLNDLQGGGTWGLKPGQVVQLEKQGNKHFVLLIAFSSPMILRWLFAWPHPSLCAKTSSNTIN